MPKAITKKIGTSVLGRYNVLFVISRVDCSIVMDLKHCNGFDLLHGFEVLSTTEETLSRYCF